MLTMYEVQVFSCFQVDGDGCIFVWQVPPLLSSTMQQKVKKKSSPLSPKSLSQPLTFSRPIIFSEEDQQCRYDSRDLLSPEMFKKIEKKATHQGGDTQETKKFKFSMSRLPGWARAKLTSSNVLRERCLTPSQVYCNLVLFSVKNHNNQSYST